MRTFDSLTEREILALAIAMEEEDERVYADHAYDLKADFPSTAAVFEGMREEESSHRRRLIDLYREKFGDHIPVARRQVGWAASVHYRNSDRKFVTFSAARSITVDGRYSSRP